MNVALRYKEEWVELCSVYARIANSGLSSKTDSQQCTATKDDGILDVYVRVNEQWLCTWNKQSVAAAVNWQSINSISKKYNDAVSAAMADSNYIVAVALMRDQIQHQNYFQTDTHSYTLQASATSEQFWGSGAKCDLTLMGKIRRLMV